MLNSKRNLTILTNFVIVFMLVTLTTLAFTYNTKYAFKENDNNKPYYQGNQDKKCVSIMFNVYSGSEYIDGILNILDKYNAKCTFFVGGCWVEKNSDKLIEIDKLGHEIGNHGYFHKDQDKLSYDGNFNEIEPNNLLIEKFIHKKPVLFAPPSGAFSKKTLEVAANLNMKTIMWSKDTIDWRDKDTDIIVKRATTNVKNGDLILCHPTKNTLEALPIILKYFKDNGYMVVTVSENIK